MKIEARRGENLQTEWIQASVCAGVRVCMCGCVSTGNSCIAGSWLQKWSLLPFSLLLLLLLPLCVVTAANTLHEKTTTTARTANASQTKRTGNG